MDFNLFDWFFYFKKARMKHKGFIYNLIRFFKTPYFNRTVEYEINDANKISKYILDLKDFSNVVQIEYVNNGETIINIGLHNAVVIEYRGYIKLEFTIRDKIVHTRYKNSFTKDSKDFYQGAQIFDLEFHESINNLILDSIKLYYKSLI